MFRIKYIPMKNFNTSNIHFGKNVNSNDTLIEFRTEFGIVGIRGKSNPPLAISQSEM